MANLVLTDVKLVVNTVDLSDHVESVEIPYEGDALDNTAMGSSARTFLGGLTSWSASISFYQDYAAAKVDATLFGIVGTSIAITGKPTSAATSATNPEYQGNIIVTSYQPLSGSIGEVAKAAVTGQGTGALTRATS